MQSIKKSRYYVSTLELGLVIIFVTLITGSSFDELLPAVSKVLRLIAYGSVFFFSIWHLIPARIKPIKLIVAFYHRYRYFLIAVGLYFLGLIIGGLRGPDPLYSLQQTFSDAVVFFYAFTVFGAASNNSNQTVQSIFKITAIWAVLLLLGSIVVYLGNIVGWWLINPYFHPDAGRVTMLLNGPFGHANHFAYFLMIAAFSSGYLALLSKDRLQWKWGLLTAFLCLGIVLTFGRGAMLGTSTGLLIMVTSRNRTLGVLASIAAIALVAYLVAGAMSSIPVPDFIPKISFAGRTNLWNAAVVNLRHYGPLGVGSGQTESVAGMGIHNFFLEQYGEGGVITSIGVLLWLLIPIFTFRSSVLRKSLKFTIVAIMAGILVHGLFWNQFLNGLRYLTLMGVLLWTALATLKTNDTSSAIPKRMEPSSPS
jgi:hypothetical protein